jgi:hypothetical protein
MLECVCWWSTALAWRLQSNTGHARLAQMRGLAVIRRRSQGCFLLVQALSRPVPISWHNARRVPCHGPKSPEFPEMLHRRST